MDIFDIIRDSNTAKGENTGMISALTGQGGDVTTDNALADPKLAQQVAGTTTNPGTGQPLDLGTVARVYQVNKDLRGAASDDVEQKLAMAHQQGGLQDLIKTLPEQGQKLLKKWQENGGGMGFGDTMQLNGMLNAISKTKSTLQQQQGQDLANRRTDLDVQAADLDNAARRRQMAALARLQQIAQLQQGAGAGVLSPDAQDRLSATGADPMGGFAAQYANTFGSMPSPGMLEKFMDQQKTVERPIGLVYGGAQTDKDLGTVTADRYHRVYRNNMGGIRVDDTPMIVPANAAPPGQLLDASTFTPKTPGSESVGTPTPPRNVSGPRVMTSAQQKALSDANDAVQEAQQHTLSAKAVGSAVTDYMNNNSFGGRFNPIAGGPHGQAIRAIFGDTSGGKLEASAAPVISGLMNGSKGLRTQKEFEALQSGIPQTTDTNDVLARKSALLQNAAEINLKRATAYKNNVASGMSPGDAKNKAIDDVPMPDVNSYLKSNAPVDAAAQPQAKPAERAPGIYIDKQGNRARWNGKGWEQQ